ncbi:MAG: hypothetical protein V4637_19960 [Pseudomonadota bacterium]
MEITWVGIKEVFYAVGSLAGVLALSKPLIESKFQRDAARVEHIKSLLSEQDLIDLSHYVYDSRRIEDSRLRPFDQLEHERRTNQDVVRFTGPLAKYYSRELDELLSAYAKFREYVQVPEWEPHRHVTDDGTSHFEWRFNKAAFEDHQGIARDYAKHLYEATEQAERMKRAFQRFQLVAELHLYEAPLARWLLDRRFTHHKLTESR